MGSVRGEMDEEGVPQGLNQSHLSGISNLKASKALNKGRHYIPTLDGWRALSICAVMLYHLPALMVGHHSLRIIQEQGQLGVTVFFVISGLLICSRLLEEERVAGSISLKSFYIRRLFRIQPAAFTYLGTIALLSAASVIPFKSGAWISALLAFRNYYPHYLWDAPGAPYTNHFWSLAVEEHFYLVLPLLLIVTRGRKKRLLVLGLIAMISFVWARIATHFGEFLAHTDASFELLMLPSFLAAVLFLDNRARRFLSGRLLLVLGVICVATIALSARFFHSTLVHTLTFLLIMVLVFGTSLHPAFFFSRFLETRALHFIGRISYSLYLWQQLFCIQHNLSFAAPWLARCQNPHFAWIMAFGMALMSYYFIEKPFIRWGHKLTPAPKVRERAVQVA